MIPAVQTALDTIVGRVTTLEHASGAGRIFELFVMTSIARGLRDAGFSVWLQRSDGTIIRSGNADRRFIQRGGAPTGVPASSAGPGNASVIGFRWGRRRKWEIWNGIQFAGRSAATHEIDISIVPGSVGTEIRKAGGIPVGRPRVAIECKDVGTAGSLDEMRAFIARLTALLADYERVLREIETLHRKLRFLAETPDAALDLRPADKRAVSDQRRRLVLSCLFAFWDQAGRPLSVTTDPIDNSRRKGPLIEFVNAVVRCLTSPSRELSGDVIYDELTQFKRHTDGT